MGMADDFAFFALLALAVLGCIWGAVYAFGWVAHRSGSPGLVFAFRITTYLLQAAYGCWALAMAGEKQPNTAAVVGAAVGFGVVWWIRRHWSDRSKVPAV